MSNKVVEEKARAKKKEKAKKVEMQKKILIAVICVLIAGIIGVLIFRMHNANEKRINEIYSYHGQTVQLLEGERFIAILSHNVRKSGTYTKANENDRVAVTFSYDGKNETGWIINNSLHIPREWDDGHGHGNIFPRVNTASGHRHNH